MSFAVPHQFLIWWQSVLTGKKNTVCHAYGLSPSNQANFTIFEKRKALPREGEGEREKETHQEEGGRGSYKFIQFLTLPPAVQMNGVTFHSTIYRQSPIFSPRTKSLF